MTGWIPVRATWHLPDQGFGHHSLLRSPDGRLLDVTGWTNEDAMAHLYHIPASSIRITETRPDTWFEFDDGGLCSEMARITPVIRSLPTKPFCSAEFKRLSLTPISGVDFPCEPAITPNP